MPTWAQTLRQTRAAITTVIDTSRATWAPRCRPHDARRPHEIPSNGMSLNARVRDPSRNTRTPHRLPTDRDTSAHVGADAAMDQGRDDHCHRSLVQHAPRCRPHDARRPHRDPFKQDDPQRSRSRSIERHPDAASMGKAVSRSSAEDGATSPTPRSADRSRDPRAYRPRHECPRGRRRCDGQRPR